MIKRPHYERIKQRLESPLSFIQVIIGPRQVGKTTLVKQLLTELNFPWHYASADGVPASSNTWIEQQWEIARMTKKQTEASDFILVMDEIQKITNWSEYVKAQWDKDKFTDVSIKVVLLGSSSLLIQKGLSESLAGRFEINLMMHWTFAEMEAAFGFTPEEYVWYGGYPGPVSLIADEERWRQYLKDALIETTISRDILMMTRIDKPALLKNLFELSGYYSGQIFSLTKMIGQLQDAGNTTTLAHYLNLLDSAGLVAGISKYSEVSSRQKASIPKFQVYNNAFLTVQRNETFPDTLMQPEKWGRHVDSAIGAHLINSSRTGNFKVFYWRHRNAEVDFVLEKNGLAIGLEVKSGRKQPQSGLTAFADAFHPHKNYLVGGTGIAWQEFLKINPADLF